MAFKSTMLFDVLANILQKKSAALYRSHVADENFKDCTLFMLIRYLSMHVNPAVRQLVLDNQVALERMETDKAYRFLLMTVPKQSVVFIKYLR